MIIYIRPLRVFPGKPVSSCINWNDTAENVFRLIRTLLYPFSEVWTFLEKKERIIIWRAKMCVPPYDWCVAPRQVCFQRYGNSVIACRSGMIELTDVTFLGSHYDARNAIFSSLRNRLICI